MDMWRTILCTHCKSTFDENILKQRNSENVCPVCGESLLGDNDSSDTPKETTKWYYYKEGGGTLMTTLSSSFTPLYTFDAMDMKDAERQLKDVLPNSPLVNDDQSDKVRCPYCRSTEYTLLNRGYSIFTGFLGSGKVKRVCNRCKKEF